MLTSVNRILTGGSLPRYPVDLSMALILHVASGQDDDSSSIVSLPCSNIESTIILNQHMKAQNLRIWQRLFQCHRQYGGNNQRSKLRLTILEWCPREKYSSSCSEYEKRLPLLGSKVLDIVYFLQYSC